MTKQKSLLTLLIALFAIGNLSAQNFKAADILGIWFNEEKDAKELMKFYSDTEVMEHYDIDPVTTIKSASRLVSNFRGGYHKKSGIR